MGADRPGDRFGGAAMTMIDTAMGALRATVAKALGRCGDRARAPRR